MIIDSKDYIAFLYDDPVVLTDYDFYIYKGILFSVSDDTIYVYN